MALTLPNYLKTTEGQKMVESMELFCLDGHLYQGYKGAVASTEDDQVTKRELDQMVDDGRDVDGTVSLVIDRISQHDGAAEGAVNDELQKRRAVKLAQRAAELAVLEAEQRLGLEPAVPAVGAVVKMPPIILPEASKFEPPCELCGKADIKKGRQHAHRLGKHRDHFWPKENVG